MTTKLNRRAMLAGVAAAAAAVPVPAIAAEPDPIYAAIEARKATLAACAGPEDIPDAAARADHEAILDMVYTEPTTIAGCITLLQYVLKLELDHDDILRTFAYDDDDRFDDCGKVLLRTLADALTEIAAKGAAMACVGPSPMEGMS